MQKEISSKGNKTVILDRSDYLDKVQARVVAGSNEKAKRDPTLRKERTLNKMLSALVREAKERRDEDERDEFMEDKEGIINF